MEDTYTVREALLGQMLGNDRLDETNVVQVMRIGAEYHAINGHGTGFDERMSDERASRYADNIIRFVFPA
ncbi:hypothetical protein SEA_GINGERBUG_55 [Microbacterium phage Gingerbug]|nr:hypothetical protein SEA_GINGERBUG_55 [Microbacterium phage Gingerbug]